MSASDSGLSELREAFVQFFAIYKEINLPKTYKETKCYEIDIIKNAKI